MIVDICLLQKSWSLHGQSFEYLRHQIARAIRFFDACTQSNVEKMLVLELAALQANDEGILGICGFE